jgi:hypothetical protein
MIAVNEHRPTYLNIWTTGWFTASRPGIHKYKSGNNSWWNETCRLYTSVGNWVTGDVEIGSPHPVWRHGPTRRSIFENVEASMARGTGAVVEMARTGQEVTAVLKSTQHYQVSLSSSSNSGPPSSELPCFFFTWGETESTWYCGNYWPIAYCTSPRW